MKRKEAIFVLVVMILSSITGILVVGANTAVEIDDYGNHYSQRTIQSYSSTYDDCLVGFTVQHQLQTNGVTDDESPFFSPVIEVAINPDFESYESNIFYTGWDSYFIDSVKMKWNLKCPDGSYRPYDKIDEQLQTYKMEGTDNSAYLQQGAEFLYTSMDAAASEYTPAKLAKYLVSVTPSTLNYGHDSINNWIEWEEGYVTSVVNGKIPNNCYDTLSLMADFGAILGVSAEGSYVLKFNYEVVVKEWHHEYAINPFDPNNPTSTINEINDGFTVTGTHYLVFEYYEDGQSGGGGSSGGACPNLMIWDGVEYRDEGVLSIHNDDDANSDMILWVPIQTTPFVQKGHFISVKLVEIAEGYNYTHSYIDNVKLRVLTENGETYDCKLIHARHSDGSNVIRKLRFSDDKWAETEKGEEIRLRFKSFIDISEIRGFYFMIEGHNPLKM